MQCSIKRSVPIFRQIFRKNVEIFCQERRRQFVTATTRFSEKDKNMKELTERAKMNELDRPRKLHKTSGKGPVSWVNAGVTGVILAFLYGTYLFLKRKKEERLQKEREVELGKAKIGGKFDLIDHDGNPKKSEDFYGKWILLYFGFTHCPDICPDEMEKMAESVDMINAGLNKVKGKKLKTEVVPLFISVDPERDGVKEIKEYVQEFHPKMIGLTGSPEQVLQACKAFRVYFSAGPRDEDNDYIVDHTIIIYLIDPSGQFVNYYGQTKSAENIAANVMVEMTKYYSRN